MGEKYTPKKGDRVRVVLEGEVTWTADRTEAFDLGSGPHSNSITPDAEHVVSIEKIEPDAVLPDGLTVSEDGNLLNWRGENYVRQPVDEPVEVFGDGDIVRATDVEDGEDAGVFYLFDGKYVALPIHWRYGRFWSAHQRKAADPFTSERFERVTLAEAPF